MSRAPRTAKGETARAEPARHVPVLLAEVLAALAIDRPGLAVDGTFGAGGYTRALLESGPDMRVIAIDRDPTAIRAGADLVEGAGGRLRLVQGRFGDLDTLLADQGEAQADWVVLDIGVSSMQLDEAHRGFSFRQDGPLDMRMGGEGPSAADLVNGEEESTLADILYHFGEERRSRAVARAIVEARRRAPIATTAQLADLIAGVVRPEPGSPIHPATRSFQGLRIAVNDELGELVRGLHAAERVLKPGGRLAVVTFHSLEDRIVKQFFSARSGRAAQASRHLPGVERPAPKSFRLVTKGPVLPSEAETDINPRARSAKLRAGERTDGPAPPPLSAIETLASLPAPQGRGDAAVIRLLNVLAIVGLIGSAVYAYSTKYDTLYQAGQVSKLKTALHKERQAIAVLRAEWQLLTRPDRLQAAVERHLTLEPIGDGHLARLSDLPNRPDRGDEIGRLLASTATPTVTPKDKPASARDEPRTTGSVTTRTVSTRPPAVSR